MFIRPGKSYFILLTAILFVILHHLLAYTGHFGYDDLHYAELASNLLKGSVDFDDHYTFRFPVILFTALFYRIFGISDLSSSLPALLITISILVIVFNLLKDQGPEILVLGLSMCTLSNWFLFYSDKLMPDIYVALSVIWALAIINRYKFTCNNSKPLLHAFLLALSLLFGFMAKGTIILTLPLLVYLIVSDIIQKRDLKFWAYSLLSGMVLLALYLAVIGVITGNPLKRFHAISDNSYLNLCSYDQQSLKILLERIFFGFFELSIYQTLATPFIFIIAALFRRRGLHIFRLDSAQSFFQASALILFLSSSFMTISFTSYAPMCLDPRHYLFLVPVAAVPASRIITEYLTNRKTAIQVPIVLLVVTVISYFLPGDSFWKLYFPLATLFTFYYFIKPGKRSQHLFLFLFISILMLLPLDKVPYAKQVKYRQQKELVTDQVLKNNKGSIVVSNEVQIRLIQYYNGFREDQNHRFISYDEYEPENSVNRQELLLLNWYTRYLSGMDQNDLPFWARNIPMDIEPLFKSEDPELTIFHIADLPLINTSWIPLLSSFNDFEGDIPFWRQKKNDFSKDITYAEKTSNRVSGFSSSFEYPLDSLQIELRHDLRVHCSLYCYAESITNAKLVVSIENISGTGFWQALEMNRYIKAYYNWWPIKFDVAVPQKDLLPESVLKVYVWKIDNSIVYIDNFKVDVFEFSQ